MFRTHEQKRKDDKALRSVLGDEVNRKNMAEHKPRNPERKYKTPAWMFEDHRVYHFLLSQFPELPELLQRRMHSFGQRRRHKDERQLWQAALWLQVIHHWFRYGMSELETAGLISITRLQWVESRSKYRILDQRKAPYVSPAQVAKVVEHIKNAIDGRRHNGSERAQGGQLLDSRRKRVDLRQYGNATREEVIALLQKVGKRPRGRPRKGVSS